jgi:predicted DNA-binding transcriptional regulator YafY
MIDRFGRDIPIQQSSIPGWSETVVDVALSDQFLGWIFALGTGVRILSPESVAKQFREELRNVLGEYEKG